MAIITESNFLSHHANLLVGGDSVKVELISILEKKHKIKTHGNPDFYDRKYEVFTIDDARAVKSLAETKPVNEAGKKLFIFQMNGITVEAQNALLKLLEEPAEYTHFFLIIPLAHLLLPTVRSRMAILEVASGKSQVSSELQIEIAKEASAFLKAPKAKRLEQVKSLMNAITKEKKTKQDAVDFLNAIEESVHNGGVKKNAKALTAIENARKYMNDRSPSLKMLLEYMALNI